jgi:hypothetical protein
MLLAAWQGPMPWLHRHGTLADSDLSRAPLWLARHLQTYHASVSPFAGVFFGWHLHALFPGTSTDDPDQPQRTEQFRLPATSGAEAWADQLASSGSGLSMSLAAQIEFQQRGPAGPGGPESSPAGHFFERFAPSLPLPLRFCVARC